MRVETRVTRFLTGLFLALKTASLLAAVGGVVVGVFLDVPIEPIAPKALGGVALCLCLFQLNNSLRTRRRLGHWKIPDLPQYLWEELIVGAGLPAVAAYIGLRLTPSLVGLASIGLIFLIAYHLYEPIERAIYARIDDSEETQGTEDFGARQPLSKLGIETTVEEMANEKHVPGIWRILRFIRRPSWREDMSRTRTIFVWIMVGCSVFAACAAAHIAVHTDKDRPAQHHGKFNYHQPWLVPSDGWWHHYRKHHARRQIRRRE